MVKRARLLLDDGERIPVELLRDGFDDDGGFESPPGDNRRRDRRKRIPSGESPARTSPTSRRTNNRQQARHDWPVTNPEASPASPPEEA